MSKEHDLKPRMLFYKNVQRIVESLKMIAAVKSKAFLKKNKHARDFIDLTEKNLLIPLPCGKDQTNNLNIMFGASKGLCGNFISNLGLLIKEDKTCLQDNWILIGHKFPYILTSKITKAQVIYKTELSNQYENMKDLSYFILDQMQNYNSITFFYWIIAGNYPIKKQLKLSHDDIKPILHFNDQTLSETQIEHGQFLRVFAMINDMITSSIMMEENCRLYAMDQAVRNADKLIIELQRTINQARQQGITNELNEIISGCEYA